MEIALTVALLAAAVALVGPLATHRLAVWRERRARRAAACATFRASVLETLRGLYPEPVEWPHHRAHIINLLESKFAALQAAVATLRPYLPLYNRWRFDRAWRIYRLGRDGRDVDGQDYRQYVPHRIAAGADKRVEHESTTACQATFRRNVARLLRLANAT